jgi:hypothetical protein
MRIIRGYDVASLYPSLMIGYGYISRNIPSATAFEKVYHDRMRAKAEGDKRVSDTLKLVLNTSYGAMLNQYNDMHDPLQGRSICITGQLLLTELVLDYVEACPSVKIINFNTDGVILSVEKSELPRIHAVNESWMARTGLVLEEEKIKKIVQKDVNNYIMVMDNGRVKLKGGYVTSGISAAGAWNVNNNYTVVKRAIIDHFVKGIPPRETIMASTDILEFQFIAKVSGKYSKVFHSVAGEEVPMQKVSRVYATPDKDMGTLYKVHATSGRTSKVENLPAHCVVDNLNLLTLDDIDREHYVQRALRMIEDFIPSQLKLKM